MYKLLILAFIICCVQVQLLDQNFPLKGTGLQLIMLGYTNCYYAILNRFRCPRRPYKPAYLIKYTFFPGINKLGATVECARGTLKTTVDYQWTGRC